ncbi:MAG: histidine--tRNA ligase, partial [Bacilli bacterium]|nr:histidine--tRNA ligase [Bacilli bacterium]
MSYQKIKGTLDFYGNDARKLRFVQNKASEIIKNYGFQEIITPIFENTEVFVRSSGDSSDIVTKEMYTFFDKGNRSITLRPEGTAAVVRSFLENKMYVESPLTKLFYFGPMFRYERPQAGRYRQFNQFGIEVFGEGSAFLDAEVIISAYNIFKSLGIKGIKLKINTIGDFESRDIYRQKLQDYFKDYVYDLCDDCQKRLDKNPLRILDCKVDREKEVIKNAPKIKDSLTEASLKNFQDILKILDSFGIDYDIDETLVRGLDYYTDTVFEYILDVEGDLQGLAICAGGKYADLVKSFGGPDIPGIGYAFGVERIVSIMETQGLFVDLISKADVVIITLDDESKSEGMKIARDLRCHKLLVEMDYKNNSLKQQFKLADRVKA